MQRFGQEVVLTVTDENGGQVLDASGLRVDFDIREIRGFSRASVRVYNLTDTTIGSLVGAQNRYATLQVRLHDGAFHTLMKDFFVSNSIDEKKLPDTITTLYCYSGIKKKILEQKIDVVVVNPTLQGMVDQVLHAGALAGSATPPNTRYQSFPVDLRDYKLERDVTNLEGSVQMCMRQLEIEFDFNMYTERDGILMVYKPHLEQVGLTDLDSYGILQLDTNNMRANPKIAPAQLEVQSNLDHRIEPGAVMDITQLLTAAVGSPETTLQLSNNFAKESLAGYSRYQTLTVRHHGSNYTRDWTTTATAVAPTKGVSMPTIGWLQN